MIAIIDYQMGNLRSVQKAFERNGFEARITDDPAAIQEADGVVLPGVGAFGDCYKQLQARNLLGPLRQWIDADRPFLGICLGLQILLDQSEETRGIQGLRVIPGDVRRFSIKPLKVPHMGWNQVTYNHDGAGARMCPLFEGIPDDTYFYFVHSYYVEPADQSLIWGWTNYGISFASAIWRGNLFATQFHPEKSQEAGLKLIGNFGNITMCARAHRP